MNTHHVQPAIDHELFLRWAAISGAAPLNVWEAFDKVEVVKAWCKELAEALAAGDTAEQDNDLGDLGDIEIAGPRVVFECPDGGKCVLLARRVAEDIDAHFLNFGILRDSKLDVPLADIADFLATPDPEGNALRYVLYISAPGLLAKPRDEMFISAKEQDILAQHKAQQKESDQVVPEDVQQIQHAVMQRATGYILRLKQFLSLITSDFGDNQVIVIVGTNSIGGLHDALLGPDAINRAFRFPGRSDEEAGNEFIESFGREYFDDSILKFPAKVGRMTRLHGWGNENVIKVLRLHLLRKIKKVSEDKIGFEDLLDTELREVVEFDEEAVPTWKKKKIAYHEAGHVVTALIGSDFKEVPEYCAAKPGRGFGGIMVHSMDNPESQPYRFSELQALIRTMLGGRAAEELIYGAAGITTGPSEDLLEATDLARSYLGRFGFGPDWNMSTAGEGATTGRNLAVHFVPGVNGEGQNVEIKLFNSPAAETSLYENVRRFLEQEYQSALDILKAHRPLLDAVAARLDWDVIDKTELEEVIDIYRSSDPERMKKLEVWTAPPA